MESNGTQKQRFTVPQALAMTLDELKRINVPAELIFSVGIPIGNAINNIAECIRAMTEAEALAAQKQAEAENVVELPIEQEGENADADHE